MTNSVVGWSMNMRGLVTSPWLVVFAAQGVCGQWGFNFDLGNLLSGAYSSGLRFVGRMLAVSQPSTRRVGRRVVAMPSLAHLPSLHANAGVGDMLSFQAGGGYGYQQPETCPAFQLPASFGGSYQEFCRYLAELDDADVEDMFSRGRGPQPGEPFPLKGCVLGCLIGKQGSQTGYMWGSGSWSGKCVRGNSIMNLITPLPSLGGIMTVMDTFDWDDGIWVQEKFPGTIRTDWSWADMYGGMWGSPGGTSNNVWVLEYPDIQVETSTGNENPMSDLQNTYAKLVKGSRDEVRLIEPGLMFGKLFRRPNSYLNPMPVGVDSGIKFAMIQTCSESGGYAWSGNSRDLS